MVWMTMMMVKLWWRVQRRRCWPVMEKGTFLQSTFSWKTPTEYNWRICLCLARRNRASMYRKQTPGGGTKCRNLCGYYRFTLCLLHFWHRGARKPDQPSLTRETVWSLVFLEPCKWDTRLMALHTCYTPPRDHTRQKQHLFSHPLIIRSNKKLFSIMHNLNIKLFTMQMEHSDCLSLPSSSFVLLLLLLLLLDLINKTFIYLFNPIITKQQLTTKIFYYVLMNFYFFF